MCKNIATRLANKDMPMTDKLTNSGQTKREVIDRFLRIHMEMDGLREEMKDLRTEVKSREDDLGVTVKEIVRAVALHRKGAKEKAEEIEQTIELLMSAGLYEEAADEALS